MADTQAGYKAGGAGGPAGPQVQVDNSISSEFSLTNADIHNNGAVVGLVDEALDIGWTRAANVVSYAGAPDSMRVAVSVHVVGGTNYWARPSLRVIEGGVVVARFSDLAMQQNGNYSGDANLSGSVLLKGVPANPAYTFEWYDTDNRSTVLTPQASSRISLEAIHKIMVTGV